MTTNISAKSMQQATEFGDKHGLSDAVIPDLARMLEEVFKEGVESQRQFAEQRMLHGLELWAQLEEEK